MTGPGPPKPRKQPRQSRSQLLVDSIHEACQRILEQEGPDNLTTHRIAEVAGINIASLYQYFPNKEAVLAGVFEIEMREYEARAAARFEEFKTLSQKSLRETLAAIVEMEAEQLLHMYRISPEFYLQYQHSYDINQRVNAVTLAQNNPSWEDWFPRFLGKHRAQLREGNIDLMAFITRRSLEGTMLAALAEDPAQLESSAFRQEVLTLLLNYLCK
jgi:AcrR family transcriptional regulator